MTARERVWDAAIHPRDTAHHGQYDADVLAGCSARRVRLVLRRRSLPDGHALPGWLPSQVLLACEPGVEPASRASFRAEVERRALDGLRRGDGTYDQDHTRLDLLAHRSHS